MEFWGNVCFFVFAGFGRRAYWSVFMGLASDRIFGRISGVGGQSSMDGFEQLSANPIQVFPNLALFIADVIR